MSLVDLTNQLLPGGPLHRAFQLGLLRGDSLDQKAVATMFCYVVGAHMAEDYQGEFGGPITEGSVRHQAEALLKSCGLFSGDVNTA
jgi:hypothetical protein